MITKKTLMAFCLSSFVTGTALAAVTPQQAARLGQDLTPMGAELDGNADGSIPAWNAEGAPIPADFVPGSDEYINPYSGEKPLYSIDASNWREHVQFLTEGTRGLFEKLGDEGFRIDVYPSHRDFVTPDWLYDNNRRNGTVATLVDDGLKVDGHYPGVPFPIPQNGSEVLWNALSRYVTDHTISYDTYYVSNVGQPILSTTAYLTFVSPMYKKPEQLADVEPWSKLRINWSAPARRAGEIMLAHEPGADFTAGKGRKAWQYLTGQRRVRLAPSVSFDTPNPGVAGTSTWDDSLVFNGSPERYNWKLVGKREVLIPYNNYDFLFQAETKSLLGKRFLKPEYMRWEKHRVWVIDAELKDGIRHLYKKRRLYIDEDSWQPLSSDAYDNRNELWRVQFAYGAPLYDIKSSYHTSYGGYDLVQGIYNLNTKPLPGEFKNRVDHDDRWFTPKGMARGGIR